MQKALNCPSLTAQESLDLVRHITPRLGCDCLSMTVQGTMRTENLASALRTC